MATELDTSAASAITDHPFVAHPGEPWGLCVFSARNGLDRPCNMAQSAHAETLTPYTVESEGQ